MYHIKSFFIYLLHNEIILFKQGKITYLFNILRVTITTILSLGMIFFAIFGVLAFFFIETPGDIPASEIIMTLKTRVYPMSLLLTIWGVVITQAFRFFYYCRYQWNIYNVVGANYE